MYNNRKDIEVGQHFSLDTALNIYEKGFTIPKNISNWNKLKISVSKLLILLQRLVAYLGNSFASHGLSPVGRIVELLWKDK